MTGPKPEKTTFCSKRSALGGSGAVGEGGAGGVGAVGLEYLSSSGCSNLGNAAKSGELCKDEPATKEGDYCWTTSLPRSLPAMRENTSQGRKPCVLPSCVS